MVMMFLGLGGLCCAYVEGESTILAECSLYTDISASMAVKYDSWSDLAVLAFPDEIRFASASRLLILLLVFGQSRSKWVVQMLPTNRLIDTQLGCISRHDVHWTLNV